jgi:hypothetical protein
MYDFATRFAVGVAEFEQFPRPVVCERYTGFFEGLADGSESVGGAIVVPTWFLGARRESVVEGGDVATGEDVGGGEGGRGFDSVEEENLVCGGDEDNTTCTSSEKIILMYEEWTCTLNLA